MSAHSIFLTQVVCIFIEDFNMKILTLRFYSKDSRYLLNVLKLFLNYQFIFLTQVICIFLEGSNSKILTLEFYFKGSRYFLILESK